LVFLLLRRYKKARESGPAIPEKDSQEVHAQHIHYELGDDRHHELSGEVDGKQQTIFEFPKRHVEVIDY
jgi:hypothetical protein